MKSTRQFSAAKLSQWRVLREMSLTALAAEVSRNRQTIYNWENGRTRPGANELAALAAALRCEIDELYEAA